MPRSPRVTSAEMVRVLTALGFEQVRASGSHFIYRNASGIRVTVPCHAGRILHPKVVKAIVEDCGLTVGELIERLRA